MGLEGRGSSGGHSLQFISSDASSQSMIWLQRLEFPMHLPSRHRNSVAAQLVSAGRGVAETSAVSSSLAHVCSHVHAHCPGGNAPQPGAHMPCPPAHTCTDAHTLNQGHALRLLQGTCMCTLAHKTSSCKPMCAHICTPQPRVAPQGIYLHAGSMALVAGSRTPCSCHVAELEACPATMEAPCLWLGATMACPAGSRGHSLLHGTSSELSPQLSTPLHQLRMATQRPFMQCR